MKREDSSAAVYATISAVLLLARVSAALFLPRGSVLIRWTGLAAFAGLAAGIPLLLRTAQRSRIDHAINERGGVLIRLHKLPFWHNSPRCSFFFGEKFELEYVDLLGRTHRALCKSGFFRGIEWIEDRVAGLSPES